jgi:hypothetical protein
MPAGSSVVIRRDFVMVRRQALPGVVTAQVIVAEVGDISRFSSARKLAARPPFLRGVLLMLRPTGVAPRPASMRADSGERSRWALSVGAIV